jgi:hypothetical protein
MFCNSCPETLCRGVFMATDHRVGAMQGNHEIEYLNDERGFTAYESRFWYPSQQCGSATSLYYSYEVSSRKAGVDQQRNPWY